MIPGILSIESSHTCVGFLGVNVIGFILYVVVSLDIFPVRILCPENLSNAGFKNESWMKSGCFGGINYGIKLDAFVCKMPYNR